VIVALDTSTLTMSLALLSADLKLIEHVSIGPPRRQSDMLPNELSLLLKRNQIELTQVTRLVIGLGPGSFTGLRLGISTLKGLSYALQIPLVGVSSLKALAREIKITESDLFSIALVKKGEFYVAHYFNDNNGTHERTPVTSMTMAQFAQHVIQFPAAKICGPALADYRDQLISLGCKAVQLIEDPKFPSAVHLAQLADLTSLYSQENTFALEPNYVRGSGAEENPKFPPLIGVEAKSRFKEEG
jgi:tRNA threonylcarbamoyladenosine biosynthesis protein TsaB